MNERAETLNLEIRNGSHPTETLQVSRRQPICIGRHASNDVCIDDAEVAPIHCRVSWNGPLLEVAAANREGVDVNGTLVHRAALRAGDVMRIGPADFFVREAPDPTEPAPKESAPSLPVIPDPKSADDNPVIDQDVVPLRPTTEDQIPAAQGWGPAQLRPWTSLSDRLQQAEARKQPAPPTTAMPVTSESLGAILDEDREEDPLGELPDIAPRQALSARLSDRLRSGQVRPGEQEAMRSPIILGMLGVTLALGLAAAAIYFVIGRESTQREFDAAVAEYDAQHYGQSADLFQKFLAQHAGHQLAAPAQYRMWNAKILKEIGGGSPSWKRGLDTLQESIDANRDRKDFKEHSDELVDFLTRIALGASSSAQSTFDRSQLEVSYAAEGMLPRFVPDGKVSVDLTQKLHTAFTAAQDAIIRHEFVSARLAEIEKANASRHPMEALAARRTLLGRYRELASDGRMAKLLKDTLDVEKGLVLREELNKPAVPHPANSLPRPLTLALHTRSRTEEPAGTRPVFVMAKDSCYAVDHVTGEPIWRRVVGLDSPFFPLKVETSVPGLLAFNANRLALVLLDRRNGETVWEQPLDEAVSGAPLIDQGQIYLATAGRHLYKIDLESGRITTKLTFSQKIVSPPALTRSRERLIVAGDASLVYTLTTSPLACLRVNDTNHESGSLVNGVTAVGGLALLTEPGRASGTRLHVLDAQNDETWLKTVDVEQVEGQVRDPPLIYGKMLFVASEPARISAFTVSDASGQEALSPTTSLAIPNQLDSPIYLSPGPDGQLWMAGSSVRRLQLKLNSQTFSLDSAEMAVGISSQPLQAVDQYLYAARRLPYAGSVFFSEIDREPMIGQWRTVFGSSLLAASVFPSGELVTVGEAGEIFSLGLKEIDAGGFKSSASAVLELDPKTEHPLRAARLSGGRIAVESGAPNPTLWFVGAGGQIDVTLHLEKPLDVPPVELAGGLVLPLPGRLRLVNPVSGQPVAEDLLAPLDKGQPPRWQSIERVSDKELVALDSRGRLSVFQYRTDPVRSLSEVVYKELTGPCDTGLSVVASRVAYGDQDGVLHFLDATTLEPVSTHPLGSPVVGHLWSAGSLLFAETRNGHLAAFDASGTTKSLFVRDLAKTGPAGSPALLDGRLIVGNRDGTLLSLDPAKGTLLAQGDVEQPLRGGVLVVGGRPVVCTIDGSLCRVDSFLKTLKNGT